MDSRIVAREIKNEIWPLLRGEAFTKFTTKTAWRFTPEQIHVVNFQSFNSHLAEGVGCTTFSFSLNLGIYFRDVPYPHPVRSGVDPSIQPQEYHCHLRHRLLKSLEQPVLPRRDTWYVEPDGSNLLECLADSRFALVREGLPWFQSYQSLETVLHLLMEKDRQHSSPALRRLIGYIARKLGQDAIAEPRIARAEAEFKAIRDRSSSSKPK